MMKNRSFYFFVSLILLMSLNACISARQSGKKQGSTSQRMELHKEGIIIDAKYDPQLDNLIPGYKILTVAVTNHGTDVLKFDPLRDRWMIVDVFGKRQKAINSLRIKNPHLFGRLPDRLQNLLEYPVGVSVGYSETIDLFFSNHVELASFRSVSFYSGQRKTDYSLLTNMDSPTHKKIPLGEEKTTAKSPLKNKR